MAIFIIKIVWIRNLNTKSACSKFNIKYSDEAVEVKKAVDKELLNLRKHIVDTSSHWVKIVIDGSEYDAKTDKLDKLNAALTAAKSIDPVYYDSIFIDSLFFK